MTVIYSLNSTSLIKMPLTTNSLRTLTSRSTRPDWRQYQLLPAGVELSLLSFHTLF